MTTKITDIPVKNKRRTAKQALIDKINESEALVGIYEDEVVHYAIGLHLTDGCAIVSDVKGYHGVVGLLTDLTHGVVLNQMNARLMGETVE